MSDAMSMSEFRALFGENEYRSTSKEYYEWKIFKNPYQQGKVYLECKEGIIVGSTTITPKKISIWGKELIAAEIGDTFTHPEYRRQGIFSRGVNACTKFAISEGITAIYGTPGPLSLLGYQNKLGYPPCPFTRVSHMTKHRGILLPAIRSIAKLVLHLRLNPNKDLFLSMLKHRFSRSIYFRSKETIRKEPFDILTVGKFTDEMDGLWGSPRYLFFTIRDKTYLNWRYFENSDEYQVIVARRGNKYLGYVVTKLSRDKKVGTICDFITWDDQLGVFYILIQEAEKMLRKAGVYLIQLWCVDSSPYYQPLLDQGYFDHGTSSRHPVIVFSGSDYGKILLETDAKWHFTISDSDNI